MYCDLHWGGVLRNRQYVRSLLSQCFVSCGSTNYTASWVTGYLGDLSEVLVVDELQRQAVDRHCCERPSRLRNWSVCTPPTFARRTASELITVHRPKPLLSSTGLFQESSILHILDTQRVCLVSLTTDSANLCSLLQEYHPIFSKHDPACVHTLIGTSFLTVKSGLKTSNANDTYSLAVLTQQNTKYVRMCSHSVD